MTHQNEGLPVNRSAPGPPDTPTPSRLVRLLTSWKLWTVALVLAVVAIGISLSVPYLRRWRAMEYIEAYEHATCRLTDESEVAIDERGAWSKGFAVLECIQLTRATDESIASVAALDETPELWLKEDEEHPVTEAGLAQLKNWRSLETAYFTGGGFSDRAVAALLENQSRLQELTLNRTSCGRQTLATVAEMSRIELLAFRNTRLNDDDFCELPVIANLEAFAGGGLGECSLSWLARSPKLYDLTIYESNIHFADFDHLCAVVDLTYLWLDDVGLPGEALQSLVQMETLGTLRIMDCPDLTPGDVAAMPILPELDRIDLSSDLVTPESIARLQQMPQLKVLFSYGEPTDPALREVIEERWEFHNQIR